MKISELIGRLSECENAYGDLPVYFKDFDDEEFVVLDVSIEGQEISDTDKEIFPKRIVIT